MALPKLGGFGPLLASDAVRGQSRRSATMTTPTTAAAQGGTGSDSGISIQAAGAPHGIRYGLGNRLTGPQSGRQVCHGSARLADLRDQLRVEPERYAHQCSPVVLTDLANKPVADAASESQAVTQIMPINKL